MFSDVYLAVFLVFLHTLTGDSGRLSSLNGTEILFTRFDNRAFSQKDINSVTTSYHDDY